MIDDMLSNKKLNPIVTELLIRARKLTVSPAFIKQSRFAVKKYWTQFNTLICYKNSQQKTSSTNSI